MFFAAFPEKFDADFLIALFFNTNQLQLFLFVCVFVCACVCAFISWLPVFSNIMLGKVQLKTIFSDTYVNYNCLLKFTYK